MLRNLKHELSVSGNVITISFTHSRTGRMVLSESIDVPRQHVDAARHEIIELISDERVTLQSIRRDLHELDIEFNYNR